MKGVFTLTSAADLRQKLRRDIDALRRDPESADAAFNFVVTAEHLLDWVYPGYANKKKREELRDQNVLLQIVSHIANGAKHFVVEARHHASVTESGRPSSFFADRYFGRYLGGRYFGRGRLSISLSGAAAVEFGSSISPLELAEKTLVFWEVHPAIK